MQWPLCKCGKKVAYYGSVGGYSKACEECNARNAKRQREARAKTRRIEPVSLNTGTKKGDRLHYGGQIWVAIYDYENVQVALIEALDNWEKLIKEPARDRIKTLRELTVKRIGST